MANLRKRHRSAPQREIAEEVILDYLRELFNKTKGKYSKLDKTDKKHCYNELNLTSHTFSLLKEKKGILDSDCANDSADEKNQSPTINRNTIIKAIHKLEEDEKIVYDDIREYYKYIPTPDDLKDWHPIVDVAPQIQIRALPTNNFAFFETRSANSAAICEYINDYFSNGEIRAYPLGELILCIGVENPKEAAFIPENTSIIKQTTFSKVYDLLKNSHFGIV